MTHATIILAALLSATPGQIQPEAGEPPVRVANPSVTSSAGLEIRIDAPAAPIGVGLPIEYTLTLSGPDASTAALDLDWLRESAFAARPASFDLLESTPPTPDAGVWRARIVLSTLDAGDVTPPPVLVRWIAGTGGTQTLGALLPTVLVESAIPPGTAPGEIRGIVGALPTPESSAGWWRWPLGSFAAVVAAVGAIALWLRRTPQAAAPDRRALDALARLEAEALPDAGRFGPYFDELSRIVRVYASQRFEIPADRQTTPEFLERAAAHRELDAGRCERLTRLLGLADRVKFAASRPTVAECRDHLADARRLVEECGQAPAPTHEGRRA